MPPKVQKLVFDERGGVILPAGALAPSEETLLARAYLLQGQEARRDVDQLATTSIATPEELKAFVGGRSDLTPGDILGAKVAQASAAQLREEVKQAAADQVAATAAGAQRVTDQVTQAAADQVAATNAGAQRVTDQVAQATAEIVKLQIEVNRVEYAIEKVSTLATTMAAQAGVSAAADGTIANANATIAASRLKLVELHAEKARAEQKLKDAQAAAAAPAPADLTAAAAAAPATPKAPKTPGGAPVYAVKAREKLTKSLSRPGAHPEATEAIDALDELTAGGFWSVMRTSAKDKISARERDLLQKVQQGVNTERVSVTSGSALRNLIGEMNAVAGMPSAPSTPIGVPRVASPLPSTPSTPVASPQPQTGSGLAASEVPAWKLGAARAMDLAETGDQVGALRLLTKYAATMPEEKMAQVYAFVLAQHVKYTQRDGQL